MSPAQWALLDTLVIQPLRDLGAEVYLFGSRVSGRHHPHSDVDLLYRVSRPLPAGVIARITEAIEESRFPFKVDLVNEKDLAESYRKNVLASMKAL